MPIKSQHIPMSYEEWDLLPYQPGWKFEYWDGQAHLTPNHQIAVTVAAITPRAVHAPCLLRSVAPEDEPALLALYLEAFADNQTFCDFTEEQFEEAARKDLRESFRGERAPLLPASRIAVETSTAGPQLIGAALLSNDEEYGPVLDLLFIKPQWQRRGLATALVADAMNELHRSGASVLTSCYQLANPTSQAWHRAFGFVEKPDLRYAQTYRRQAHQELHRREKLRPLTEEERGALSAEMEYWSALVDELERLAEEQGYETVHPRRPHW